MIRRVAVVCEPSVGLGFRLAGIEPEVVRSPEAARPLLDRMTCDESWGVVLVQQELLPAPRHTPPRSAESGLPILIPFPGPARERAPGEAEAYVAELLRRAVGYRVRLR